jgi:DNA-binding HxlR family transcriptional regulator
MLCQALPAAPPLPPASPVALALAVIGGKWKPRILTTLAERTRRFRELERCLPAISRKVLVEQLRELEGDGLVGRRVFPQVPPRVEYSLTLGGARALPVIRALEEYGLGLLAERRPPCGAPEAVAALEA